MHLGEILMDCEQSGPSRCGWKAEEPGNEKGGPRAREWSPELVKSRMRGAEAGNGHLPRRPWLSGCLPRMDNNE